MVRGRVVRAPLGLRAASLFSLRLSVVNPVGKSAAKVGEIRGKYAESEACVGDPRITNQLLSL